MTTVADMLAQRAYGPDGDSDAHVVADLLAAREENAGAVNRRRLFAAMDGIIGLGPVRRAPEAPRARRDQEDPSIAFRTIRLHNWKVFERAELSFPDVEASRPVVLIGGKNGFGKTSILQAVLHGLYGRHAPGPVGSTGPAPGDGRPARRNGYDEAIARALHQPARDRGERLVSVRIVLATERGQLAIDRRWHMDMLGQRLEDEELTLATGEDEAIVPLPDGEDALSFYQEYIDRHVAPPGLAPFFLFDGEQVKQLAERRAADQVRLGVEGAIGVHRYRELAADLRDYARDRDKDSAASEAEARLRAEVEVLGVELDAGHAELEGIEARLGPILSRRDTLVGELGTASRSTHEGMSELLERRHRLATEVAAQRIDLAATISSTLPLLLCAGLVERARARIVVESGVGRDRGADEADLTLLLRAFDEQGPAMSGDEAAALHSRIAAALHSRIAAAWRSPMFRAAQGEVEVIHHHLVGQRIDHVLSRVDATIGGGASRLSEAASGFIDLRREAEAAEGMIATRRDAEARSGEARTELERLNAEVAGLQAARSEADRRVGRVKADRDGKRAELERRVGRRASTPTAVRSWRALRVAEEIDRVILEAARTQFGRVAVGITEAYRAMAHKSVVDKIEVDGSGQVSLLDRAGRSLEAADPSAGESQIFAMALIAAVMDLGGARLPTMVDTPLGRLDPEHRERVLDYFTSRPCQTILLSQPDEVNRKYLALIESRIVASFHLEHIGAANGRLGGSAPKPGYFPDLAA